MKTRPGTKKLLGEIMFLILCLLALAQAAAPAPFVCPPPGGHDDVDLVACLGNLDVNTDGTATAAEIDTFIAAHVSCLPTNITTTITGAQIVTICDTNASGDLTAADYASAAGCGQLEEITMMLCQICQRCNLLGAKKKKDVIHDGKN
jgi:hypothetical protein